MTWDWDAYFQEFAARLDALTFQTEIACIYNPLIYARLPLLQYCNRFGAAPKKIIFLGMNPGPFGMVQTGVPFGEVQAVREYLRIDAPVDRPVREHPRRPVLGWACPRSEVSGQRLWGWIRSLHPRPETFFQRNFVANYCPLAFTAASGRNITPDQLPPGDRKQLYRVCDAALLELVRHLRAEWILGIGQFAARRAEEAVRPHVPVRVAALLHPSPASPAANRGWAQAVSAQLATLGIEI